MTNGTIMVGAHIRKMREDCDLSHTEGAELLCPGFLHYLATPYSKYPGGQGMAYHMAAHCVAGLTDAGVPTYSPICNYHPAHTLRLRAGSGESGEYAAFNDLFLDVCMVLVFVVDPDGVCWQSRGMYDEYMFMRAQRKRILRWRFSDHVIEKFPVDDDPWLARGIVHTHDAPQP